MLTFGMNSFGRSRATMTVATETGGRRTVEWKHVVGRPQLKRDLRSPWYHFGDIGTVRRETGCSSSRIYI